MDEKKQIEEMARTLLFMHHGIKCLHNCTPCVKCTSHHYAETLYNAGYRKQIGWISVDERLPDHCEKILVCDTSQNISTGVYYVYSTGGGDFCTPIRIKEQITHWMPLPEPPVMKGGAE